MRKRTRGRRSIRLRHFNYATPCSYYVTIVIEGRRCVLSHVVGNDAILTPIGELVRSWWLKIPARFPTARIDADVFMPNHVHAIIRLHPVQREGHLRLGPPLSKIVQWFKTMTTNAYYRASRDGRVPRIEGRLWQRNFYEHVIRDEEDLGHAHGYIRRNPLMWPADPENPAHWRQDTKEP